MKLKTNHLAIAVMAALTLTSCEETENLGFTDAESNLSEKYIAAEAALSNIYRIVDNTMRDSILRATDSTSILGAIVSKTGPSVLVDFGGGVIGPDGTTRSGSISIIETNDYRMAGGVVVVDLANYSVDNFNVLGNLSLENYGSDSLKLNVTNLVAVDSFMLDGSKSMSWLQGFETPTTSDDKYEIRGSAHGIYLTNSLMSNITVPMVIDNSCQHKVLGGVLSLDFQSDSTSAATTGGIDFIDDDGCENLARINIKKGETEITLARQFNGF